CALRKLERMPVGILLDGGRNYGIVRRREEAKNLAKFALRAFLHRRRRDLAGASLSLRRGADERRHATHEEHARQDPHRTPPVAQSCASGRLQRWPDTAASIASPCPPASGIAAARPASRRPGS